MHSYGFTSGIARWLLAFVGVEVIFIMVTLLLTRNDPARGGATPRFRSRARSK
jgi:hypothetical protein